ncbi:exodeoxyribonuclease VII small subunit [Thiomicrospira microaerophila]|uniref:exodeoxyribonuclease VII small subunit n=1 Tax=Thiomicrospira microaerophila TaxID=406020 RepID=UPI002010759E|nr:exodeoxyribonuclease VII small subunit [Thiomicrospira microaerophila]UQB43300.1 exodeoxyribonuclease VII small subunit [Thiomicrospira microaerophila]
MSKTNKAESFKENYARLQQIANQLMQTDEVDIDQLVPMVDEASRAYQACKSRLDAVEAALSQRLEKEETNEPV